MNPKASIIIPVYNVKRFLPECIESVMRQTLTDIEIILVDDGSTDGSGAMCDEYAKKDSRIKVIHKKNAGLGFARNSGMDVCTGDWIAFVDSDDLISTNFIEILVGIGEENKVDGVRCLMQIFDYNTTVPKYVTPNHDIMVCETSPDKEMPIWVDISADLLPQFKDFPAFGSACTGIYRHDVLRRMKLRFKSERELVSEDFVFNIEFATFARKIAYTKNKFYFYRVNHSSITGFREDRLDKSAIMSEYIYNRLSELGVAEAEMISMGYFLGAYRLHLRNLFKLDLSIKERKKLLYAAAKHPHVKDIAKNNILRKVPFLQRISFALRGNYYLSYILYKLRDAVRRN